MATNLQQLGILRSPALWTILDLPAKRAAVMTTALYYFSSSGNSLWISREIARRLGETELIPIPDAINRQIEADKLRIGLVFPVHYFGVPEIVIRFIKNCILPPNAYAFAVVISNSIPLPTLNETSRLFSERGMTLSAGFSVNMTNSCTAFTQGTLPYRLTRPVQAVEDVERICGCIYANTELQS